jgi:hypothetical protein
LAGKAAGLQAGRCIADYFCSLWLRAAEEGIEESPSLGYVSVLDTFKVLDFEAVLGNNLPMPTGILLESDTHLAAFGVVGLDCVILNAYW